ncbi:3'(2'),5'-bisphosphate nucleotidase [Geodermatophilus telluris]|uniref:3'(2'),5-bisphosphonucleoside 3'(2')-phosphohydrolase n=1 Tax=Geodermatophilus telluris TaxID=1190417 RepID=A0A1G6L6C8_9ACTN|nr:3'(2'),5'-bisphosphate nucleotidase CysQ [Geodermatophilus telluris]SDC38275.1 3'(2'),5'-bisphosphate nucleotidase [Geodermatophilus telluris]
MRDDPSTTPLTEGLSDAELAAVLARTVGQRLRDLRRALQGSPPEEVRTRGDAEAQTLLAGGLAAARPSDAVLSEEAPDDGARIGARRVWIIDPLDGTREFSEDRSDWAVHVALWADADLVTGAVALPGLDVVLTSATSPVVPDRDPAAPLRMAVSRTRPPSIATAVAAAMDAELVAMGSAGFKVAAVVRGEVDFYVHGGGQYEWDSAAPVAVARAAGLHTSRLDGSPLRYNQPDPHLPDLVVCRPELAPHLMSVIAQAGAHR